MRNPPRIVEIVYDDGTRMKLDDMMPGPQRRWRESERVQVLRENLAQLERQWLCVELGIDYSVTGELDALDAIETQERNADLISRLPLPKESKKEGDITREQVADAERAIRDMQRDDPDAYPEHRIRGLIAERAGVSRARVDQILGPVGGKTKIP